jgi:hypothetical protein
VFGIIEIIDNVDKPTASSASSTTQRSELGRAEWGSNILRKIALPCTLHFSNTYQCDIDDELSDMGLAVSDEQLGIVQEKRRVPRWLASRANKRHQQPSSPSGAKTPRAHQGGKEKKSTHRKGGSGGHTAATPSSSAAPASSPTGPLIGEEEVQSRNLSNLTKLYLPNMIVSQPRNACLFVHHITTLDFGCCHHRHIWMVINGVH